MKNWFAASLAAVLVVLAGSAIASVPSGSGTDFAVQDPAVTVIASGQPDLEEGNPATFCNFSKESLTYCHDTDTLFTPSVDGVCQVSIYGVFQGEPGGEAGNLNGVSFGVGERTEGEADSKADPTFLVITPNHLSEQTVSRTRLIPVQGGVEYEFAPWIQSQVSAHGRLYWEISYVCFGA